jgi:hypothetical protein
VVEIGKLRHTAIAINPTVMVSSTFLQDGRCAGRSSLTPPLGWGDEQLPAELIYRIAAFEANINADPCAVADRLWVKDHLDPEEEKLRFSNETQFRACRQLGQPGESGLQQFGKITHQALIPRFQRR